MVWRGFRAVLRQLFVAVQASVDMALSGVLLTAKPARKRIVMQRDMLLLYEFRCGRCGGWVEGKGRGRCMTLSLVIEGLERIENAPGGPLTQAPVRRSVNCSKQVEAGKP